MRYAKEYPTQERLKQLFNYKYGFLIWNPRPLTDFKCVKGFAAFNFHVSGKVAHAEEIRFYKKIKINGEIYFTHRLIYIWNNGDLLPVHEIDHIDNNPSNNLIDNLRLADRAGNSHNTRTPKHNTSGLKGVSWDRFRNKWVAQIKIGDLKIRKRFSEKSDADEFVKTQRELLHGEFHNHG